MSTSIDLLSRIETLHSMNYNIDLSVEMSVFPSLDGGSSRYRLKFFEGSNTYRGEIVVYPEPEHDEYTLSDFVFILDRLIELDGSREKNT